MSEENSKDDFSYWNTRVIRHHVVCVFENGNTIDEYCFEIHEVYYDEKEKPVAWTEKEIRMHFYDAEDFKNMLEHINSAMKETVLELETVYTQKDGKTIDGDLIDSGKTFDEFKE